LSTERYTAAGIRNIGEFRRGSSGKFTDDKAMVSNYSVPERRGGIERLLDEACFVSGATVLELAQQCLVWGSKAEKLQLSKCCPLFSRLCCKALFGSLKTNFLGCGRGDRIIMWGTTATSDEFTGNFGSALEDTSISDCRLVALFAEKSLQAIFGVLQHNRHL
jgi:hypothetical protein